MKKIFFPILFSHINNKKPVRCHYSQGLKWTSEEKTKKPSGNNILSGHMTFIARYLTH